MSWRCPKTGRYAVPPGGTLKRHRRPVDHLLITDQRSVIARHLRANAGKLRAAFTRQGRIVSPTVDLEILALARIATKLRIMQAELERGQPISDEQLVRLSNALSRGLVRLGLKPTTLAPPSPVKPMRPLSTALRDGMVP